MTSQIKEYMGDIIAGRTTLQEASDFLQKECNKKMQEEFPRKLEDPGKFGLPITIGQFHYRNSLVDTGASINMMPVNQAKGKFGGVDNTTFIHVFTSFLSCLSVDFIHCLYHFVHLCFI